MESTDRRVIILSMLIFSVVGIIFLVTFIWMNQNTAPDDSSALFAGELETRFPYVGYMMTDREVEGSDGNTTTETYLCGINYISESIGITAAHCVEDYLEIFPNQGSYSSSYSSTSLGGEAFSHPQYTGSNTTITAGVKDIAVVVLESNISLNEYANISSPSEGCDYYITGYGLNEGGLNFERRGGSVCIDLITPERVELTREAGFAFFCGGDSGSGIYESETNNLVAIVSAYYPAGDCQSATRFYATRVDINTEFVNEYFDTDGPTPTPEPTNEPTSSPTNTPSPTNPTNAPTNPPVNFTSTPRPPTPSSFVNPTENFGPTSRFNPTALPTFVPVTPTPDSLPYTAIETNRFTVLLFGIGLVMFGIFIKFQVESSK